MKTMDYDIFISYRREDGAEFAEGLANSLRSDGYAVFFDKENLTDGKDFPYELKKAINDANEFIMIVSPSYFGLDKKGEARIQRKMDWVCREIEVALSDNSKNFFPIIIDCNPPSKASLPHKIRRIADKNFIRYDRSYDTFEKIRARIQEGFKETTKENALIGVISAELKTVDVNDNGQFNIACKSIINRIQNEKDKKALLHILGSKTASGKRHMYKRDYRFVVFYTLFTYFRRMHEARHLVAFVEKYGNDFKNYAFFDYVMVQYNHTMFALHSGQSREEKRLKDAIRFARRANKKLPDNNGIIHSYPYAVAMALENGVIVSQNDIKEALKKVDLIIDRDPNYGGMYYSTKARILGQTGDYEEALDCLKLAQELERPNHEDWILRIASYQKYEVLIRIKELEAKIQN